jgi:acetyltransferase-like isoleucine patch superfamily enzyme
MLTYILRKLDFKLRGVKIWRPSNVYRTAELGDGVSVGMFSEIGHNVVVGEDTRIGMGAFIPEGVVIGNNCFIGPKVCMVHDVMMHTPPFSATHKEEWTPVIIEDDVRLGANVLVLPGVTIHKGAIVGMGSVVTRNIGAYEVWAGNPARKLRNLKEDSNG